MILVLRAFLQAIYLPSLVHTWDLDTASSLPIATGDAVQPDARVVCWSRVRIWWQTESAIKTSAVWVVLAVGDMLALKYCSAYGTLGGRSYSNFCLVAEAVFLYASDR